jgi:hypothetical protein
MNSMVPVSFVPLVNVAAMPAITAGLVRHSTLQNT